MSNLKKCNTDNDCNENTVCAFDESKMDNYCIDNSMSNLYYGCLNPAMNNNNLKYESIETKTLNHTDYRDCIDFTKKQKNKDGLNYNYMVYRPKRKIFVDLTTINIYLKINNEIIAVIPYEDYFNVLCDKNTENCVLESKETIHNFIKKNTMDILRRGKTGKITLEVVYECENEGLKKNQVFDINLNEYKPLKINMNCPIDSDNSYFQSKCEAIYVNPIDDNLYSSIDNNVNMNNCLNPLFKVPFVVDNKSKYDKIKSKHTLNEMKKYDDKIAGIEAERYVRLKKLLYGENVPYEDALKIVSDKNGNNEHNKNKWKIFSNMDAAQKLFSYNENQNEILKYYGKVYTIQDAMDAANENNEFLFVWYHNSYELDNYASKLFFIDIYSINENILNKKEWIASENVTTGVLNFEMENFTQSFDNNISEELGDMIQRTTSNNDILLSNIDKKMEQYISSYKDINDNIIDNLDSKITTYGQAISMNNYETNINNKILIYLGIISGILFIILIIIIVYKTQQLKTK